MDFLTIAKARQSCRSYESERTPEREKLEACLEAARLAPSACNSQPYHFTAACGEAAKQVADCTHGMGMNQFTELVPAFIIVSEERYNLTAGIGSKIKGQDYRAEDIGIAVAYLTSEAAAQGLATCILGWFDEKKLKKVIGSTKPIRLVIAIGYASAGDPLRPKTRKSSEELITWL